MFLMPPSVKDWLTAGHLADFISNVIDGMHLSAILDDYAGEERGFPHHPAMMVRVRLYAYWVGLPSSRRITRGLVEDAALRTLAANMGRLPSRASMDAGSFIEDDVEACGKMGVEAFVASERLKHGEQRPPAPKGRIPQGLSAKELARRMLQTVRDKATYERSKTIADPVCVQTKQARRFR